VDNLVLSVGRLISSVDNLACQGTGRFHKWIPSAVRRQTDFISGYPDAVRGQIDFITGYYGAVRGIDFLKE
jgi:hypothetical protein